MRKLRYRWGFKFGKLEHKYRYIAFWYIFIGIAAAGYGWYTGRGDSWIVGLGVIVAGIGITFEAISLIAHLIEKRFMDKLRRH